MAWKNIFPGSQKSNISKKQLIWSPKFTWKHINNSISHLSKGMLVLLNQSFPFYFFFNESLSLNNFVVSDNIFASLIFILKIFCLISAWLYTPVNLSFMYLFSFTLKLLRIIVYTYLPSALSILSLNELCLNKKDSLLKQVGFSA